MIEKMRSGAVVID